MSELTVRTRGFAPLRPMPAEVEERGSYGCALTVAGTGALGRRTGRAATWREELTALRRHPVAGVRDAAPDEVTAYE